MSVRTWSGWRRAHSHTWHTHRYLGRKGGKSRDAGSSTLGESSQILGKTPGEDSRTQVTRWATHPPHTPTHHPQAWTLTL